MDEEQRTTEVRTTEVQDGPTNVQRQTVSQARVSDGAVVAQRIVWYVAGFIMVFLALRLILLLLGANQGNLFVDLVYAIGGFFAAPFSGIFGSPTYGEFFFDTASLVAIVVYGLLAWGIAKLFTLNGAREV
ncbi:hypothetical protein B7Y94_03645 [Candidatus Saccharibacteria bacterium 32-49-12]|nr:MAG: hypothetical protein B7Y94_03645 [Candidatus Saccharibacteria bacterium 32-49-12]